MLTSNVNIHVWEIVSIFLPTKYTDSIHSLRKFLTVFTDRRDHFTAKKRRAQFELYQLTENEYPAAVVACSITGFNGLLLLAARAERNSSAGEYHSFWGETALTHTMNQAPNKGSKQVEEPRMQSFHRAYGGADRFTVVANTAPLFENVPDHNAVQNAIIKNLNIDGKFRITLSWLMCSDMHLA